jgi:hypothetical protein
VGENAMRVVSTDIIEEAVGHPYFGVVVDYFGIDSFGGHEAMTADE